MSLVKLDELRNSITITYQKNRQNTTMKLTQFSQSRLLNQIKKT
nr:MAG TPA: hypothetical protein [Caudoviricetes sp.]